ncbi:MAG: tetratricopeptide repeat protein, partial [Desulfovibrio sp.]|nr:tetratricopeptide repeat protein [Desulfovibrio sp.]
MTEKIEWYKEVLELEPNSKVFFPLARLLVEEDRRDEAIAVLERGLDRHKEYLEARLLLIELLFQSGRMTECDREISDLSKVLTSYAGFWRAWAACLSSSQTEEASALKFLAAQFLCGPISLREALDKGVEAIVAERDERKDRDIIVELHNDVLKASEPAVARNQNDLHDISVASVNFEHDKNTITSNDMTVADPLQNHSRETINEEFVADIKEDPSRPELESFHETDGARGSAITGQSSAGAERENGAPASPAGVYDLETGEKTGYNIE